MPRPPSQPLLRAPRPTHPLAPAREAPPAPAVDRQVSEDPLPDHRGRVDVADVDPPPGTALDAEPLRTFTTRLPVDLRRRLRRHAIDTDQTLEQVARAMVREYLDRHEADH